jgi:hypothetical protein
VRVLLSTRNGSPNTPGLTTKKFGVAKAFNAASVNALFKTALRLLRNVDVLKARLLRMPNTFGANGFNEVTKPELVQLVLVER